MDICPACGANVDEGAETCASCGAALREVTASFPPVVDGVESTTAVPLSVDGPLLVVRKGPEVGERFYLDRARLVIGRDPVSDIFLNDITVSREHALLEVVPDEVSVADAGSLNGTYVNGVSVDKAVLRSGDQLQIGRFQMVFLSGGGE
ncbi:MAG: FHA domain-containing protein [Coriobacteriia bacterium]|nr:FHA domain-containing protein [Coriobacteriia bacterium]